MLASKIGLGGLCWALKSVLEGLLWGLGAILAPRANQDPQGEEMGLQGSPWDLQLGGQVGPIWVQVGHNLGILWTCALIFVSNDPAEPHLRPT